jgi:lipoprotein-anchoring transpeptidase ErfK/SrfK
MGREFHPDLLKGSMPNYREILSRALRKGDFADPFWRREVYGRTRQMLVQQLRRTQPSINDGKRQLAAFDATIESIESEFEHAGPSSAVPSEELRPVRGARSATELADKSGDAIATWISARPIFSVVAAVAVAVIVAGAYALWTARSPQNTPAPASVAKNEAKNEAPAGAPVFRGKRQAKAASLPEGELAPGVDGGSGDADVPYVFRRQPVFYRTTNPVGTVIVDKQQHFLYLIQPKSVALRYGIALSSQCNDLAGLRRISSKLEWPAWQPTPELVARRLAPAGVLPGGPGNPLGARLLGFEDGNSIHGTNAPKSIGNSAVFGCIRLVNDDVIDLYQRVPVGGRVVISN